MAWIIYFEFKPFLLVAAELFYKLEMEQWNEWHRCSSRQEIYYSTNVRIEHGFSKKNKTLTTYEKKMYLPCFEYTQQQYN